MEPKRSASEQVAFRIEPLLSKQWAAFIADTLIPNRAHHACAMMLYLAASAAQRDCVHRLFARFQRTGQLALSEVATWAPSADSRPLTADEVELLNVYREATGGARDEAIANLQDRADSTVHRHDTGETRDHRVG